MELSTSKSISGNVDTWEEYGSPQWEVATSQDDLESKLGRFFVGSASENYFVFLSFLHN